MLCIKMVYLTNCALLSKTFTTLEKIMMEKWLQWFRKLDFPLNQNSHSKMEDACLRKLLIWFIKVIPVCISVAMVLYTILAMFKIHLAILSTVAGFSIISATILLLNSFVFKFCFYHRIFIYYIYIVNLLNIIDWYLLISVSSKWFIAISIILFMVCAFAALYLHMKKYEIRIIKTRT